MKEESPPLPAAQKSSRPLLYVEDEENDAEIARFGLKLAGITRPLRVVPDGKQAIDYLSGSGQFADRQKHPLPCLVLLDLNLPQVSGMEVLAWARKQPHLRDLAFVIFTSSDQQEDRKRALELGATDYIVKPGDLNRLRVALQELNTRWLSKHCPAD